MKFDKKKLEDAMLAWGFEYESDGCFSFKDRPQTGVEFKHKGRGKLKVDFLVEEVIYHFIYDLSAFPDENRLLVDISKTMLDLISSYMANRDKWNS